MFTKDREYDQWLGLPLQPGKYRRTVRRQIGSGIWVFEQTQGVLEVCAARGPASSSAPSCLFSNQHVAFRFVRKTHTLLIPLQGCGSTRHHLSHLPSTPAQVIVNIRMTAVKLRDGSLFIHAPVAPTKECIRLVEELGCPVKYIVLPTSAVEHKARPAPPRPGMGAAARRRRDRAAARPGWSDPAKLEGRR